MRTTYEEHQSRIASIRSYIQTLKRFADLPNAYPEEEAAKKLKSFLSIPQKRGYDYSLVIITLYGIWESYVENIACAYLKQIKRFIACYENLPEAIRKNHLDLSVKLLGSSSNKFENVKSEDVIANLHSCLSQGQTDYDLNIEAFRQHTSNFRKDSLLQFLKQIGISDIQAHICNDEDLKKYILTSMGEYESDAAIPETKYYELLDDLIERRNVVAHGSSVDDLLSLDILDDYAQYIQLLMKPIYEGLAENFFAELIRQNLLHNFGPAIAVYNNRIVCVNSANQHIKLKCVLLAQNDRGHIKWGTIDSMQVDKIPVNEVTSDIARDIGMQVNFSVKDTYTYYYYPYEMP